MRQVALALLALTLLVPAAVTVGAQAPGTGQSATAAPDPAGLTVAVHVQADGDAKWNVSVRYELADENETDSFASLLADYRNGADVGPSADVFRSVANAQSDRTGREMSIQGVSRDGSLTRGENATGVLSLSFTWTNFSVVSGTEIRVDDAFSGGWFGDLRDNERLVVYPPDGYSLDSASPASRVVDGGALWDGPQPFETGPAVTFTRGTTSTGPPGNNGGVPWALVLGAAAVALLAGGVAVFLWNNRDLPVDGAETADGDGGVDDGPGGPEGGAVAAGATAEAESATEADETAAGDAAPGETAAGGAAAGEAAADESEETEELLSDEERVERLLRENGGRMKQRKIVEETRWSNAKVSQLLSAMAEEGRVEKLRIGRENLISLPDENGD